MTGDQSICLCTTHHSPTPTTLVATRVGTETVHLCPTSHVNLNALLALYILHDGRPDWTARRRYNPYVQSLAAQLWVEKTKETE